jgi:hypothetical protein
MVFMKHNTSPTEKNSLGNFLAGSGFTILGVVCYWFGLNSALIGVAYYYQKGFWLPCLVGTCGGLVGIYWIYKGVNKFLSGRSSRDSASSDVI